MFRSLCEYVSFISLNVIFNLWLNGIQPNEKLTNYAYAMNETDLQVLNFAQQQQNIWHFLFRP